MNAIPSLDSILGGLLLALVISGALWGVSCSQASWYFAANHCDPAWLRTLVFMVWAADTAHQVLITQAFYDYTVTHSDNYFYLDIVPRTAPAQIATTQLLITLVQGLYTWRIWKLSQGRSYVVAAICVLIAAESAAAIGDTIAIANSYTWTTFLANSRMYNIAYSALTCAADVVLTSTMVHLLHQHRTEMSSTNGILNRVTALLLATNLLTTMLTVAILVLAISAPDSFYVIPLFHVSTRLYGVSFLAALNLREFLAHGLAGPQDAIDMSAFHAATYRSDASDSASPRTATGISLDPWNKRVTTDEFGSPFPDGTTA